MTGRDTTTAWTAVATAAMLGAASALCFHILPFVGPHPGIIYLLGLGCAAYAALMLVIAGCVATR
jgi:hypothetical protein